MDKKIRVLDPFRDALVGKQVPDVVASEELGEVFRGNVGIDGHQVLRSGRLPGARAVRASLVKPLNIIEKQAIEQAPRLAYIAVHSSHLRDRGFAFKRRRRSGQEKFVMTNAPLMPKATAVWLVENTALSFDQIAQFCSLHPLEVKAIADGDAAQGIKGI